MFVNKIKSGQSGILLYGITPPKVQTTADKIADIAGKTVERLKELDFDALVVYDVQDEAARTAVERPFPFLTALDPFTFANEYLNALEIPKIIYRPAGKYTPEEISTWLGNVHQSGFYPVFVGVPIPGFPVKTSLPDAYQLWSKYESDSVIGAITIPERHALLKDEDSRILEKTGCGVSYFISQCVFDLGFAKKLIEDLHTTCTNSKETFPTIIFTLASCGSLKTLEFMDWLGIHIPADLKEEFRTADNILEKSTQVCLGIAAELTTFCTARSIPFGFNIESVAIRKEEIEASVTMLNKIGVMLKEKGLRKDKHTPLPVKPSYVNLLQ